MDGNKLQDNAFTASKTNEINKLLDNNESAQWSGAPNAAPFIAGHFNPFLIVFGLFFAGVGAAVGGVFSGGVAGAFLVPHTWIGLLVAFGPPIQGLLSYLRTYYMVTSKRIIIQKGIIGTDFELIDFDKITSVDVNVGLVDKLFGNKTGTISIEDGTVSRKGRPRSKNIQSVESPYDVFKLLKSVSHDVKTDISYPNAMRPDSNPGYNTKLK